jgi:hypothetical protein
VNTWIAENSMVLIIALAAAGAVLLITTIALLIGWLHARHGRARETARRVRLDRERLDLELSLAEQTSRLRIIRELHEVSVHDMSVIIGQGAAGDVPPHPRRPAARHDGGARRR